MEQSQENMVDVQSSHPLRDPRLIALGLFLLLALPTVFSWVVTVRQDRELLRTQTEITSGELSERLSDHLTLRYAMMRSLSLEMSSGGLWDRERFKSRADQIEVAFPGFQAINWVDPEGVIRWVNPQSRNAPAEGKRLSEHPQAGVIFEHAQREWVPRITGPMQLFQGGVGFASYFPIGTKDEPRGFVNAVFRVEPLIAQVLSPRVLQYFHVAVSAGDGILFVHGEQPNRDAPFFVQRPLRFEDREWTLQLAPSPELTTLTLSSSRRTLMGILGLSAALIASFLALRFLGEHEARSRLASLVEASDDLIALFDASGRLRYMNRAGRLLLEAGSAEVGVGDVARSSPTSTVSQIHWTQLLEPRHPVAAHGPSKKALTSLGSVQGGDWLLRPQNGSALIDAEVVTFPVRGQRREVLFGMIARDTRQRNRLERQLVQSQKMEAVGTLAGGVAHDFNNLLTAIVGNAELAKLDAKPGSELELSLGNILDAADLAAGLTTRLLAFSRRDNPNVEPFGLDDAVQASARLLRRLLREDVALDVVTAAPNATLRGDPAELQQVLMNLVVNARDAIETNGRIQVCTSVDYGHQGTLSALLEVIDNGCGMTPDVIKCVFEPFFTTKPTGKGTGLGLAMVKSAVDRLGGTIAVESKLGEGTRIAITLPAEDKPLSIRRRPHLVLVDPQKHQSRILLAEDSSAIRKVMEAGLERAGYAVVAKESGAAAVRELESDSGHFDALLTDVVMPGGDGVSVARVFRRRFPDSVVIFTSGYEDEGAALDVVLNSSHFLPKPFRLTELLEILDSHVRPSVKSARAVNLESH